MSISITHAKIIKGKSDVKHLSVSFERQLQDGKWATCEEEFPQEIHDDLAKAFGLLDPHLALINEFIPYPDDFESVNPADYENFHASSFSYGGNDDSPSIVISGHKILSTGKAFNFYTVSTKLDEDEENAYPFLDELKGSMIAIKVEVEKYMDGKHAPEVVNGTLDFPDDKVTHAQIDEPLTPEKVVGEIVEEANGTEKTKKGKRTRQTADHPNGIEA